MGIDCCRLAPDNMNYMKEKGARIVVGGQWGDEGKSLISAYLTARYEIEKV